MMAPRPGNPKHTKILTAAALLLAGLGPTPAHAERPLPPNAPSWTKTELTLDAADVTLRTLDLVSTRALLASPCRCFHEDDPLAPGTGAVVPLAAFQYGMSALLVTGSHRLRQRGHGRLSLLLMGVELAGESYAVQHNLRQRAAAPVVHTGLIAGGAR